VKTRYGRLISIISLVFITSFLFVSTSFAQSRTLRWLRWDVDVTINSDGTFDVYEEREVQFIGGDFRFGYFELERNQFTSMDNLRISEPGQPYEQSRSEQPHTYYVDESSSGYDITWYYPTSRDETRTFIIEYTISDGIIISDEVGDRFFWKVISGNDFPVESSTVAVTVPPGTTVDTSIDPFFDGADGSYELSADHRTVVFEFSNIPAEIDVEVGVRFPHGFIPADIPPWQPSYEREQRFNDTVKPVVNVVFGALGVLILLAGIPGMIALYMMVGRDPEVGPMPEYVTTPPSDLRPGVVGTLVDEKADLEDIMGTLVDLARRGYLVMEEDEKSLFGLTSRKAFTFHRVEEVSWDGLLDVERNLLRSVFGGKEKVSMDALKDKFYVHIEALKNDLYDEVVKEEFFPRSPKVSRGLYTGLGILGIVVCFFGTIASLGLTNGLFATVACPGVAGFVVSIVLLSSSRALPKKTQKGAEEAAKWMAFRNYLRNIEQYTDIESVTDTFDDFLPYAIAFGIEDGWVKTFSRVQSTPVPPWYYPVGVPYGGRGLRTAGRGGLPDMGGNAGGRGPVARPTPSLEGLNQGMVTGLNSMASGLTSMLNSTARTFSSAPSSSGSGGGFSGGGFSGGGFSGGGGGGGGGSGFG